MSEQSSGVRRFFGWTIIWVILIAFLAIPVSIGIGVAMATHGNPLWEPRIHIAVGLLFLATGLVRQFRMAAYAPKGPTENRVKDSLMNSAIILLGLTQLANDSVIETPIAILALTLMLAAAFRRPRRYF